MTQNPLHPYIEIGNEFRHDEEHVQIHAQLLKKLHGRITRSFQQDEKFPNRNYLITGRRGSGKSTFLENLLELLLDNQKTHAIDAKIRFAKLLQYDPSASNGGDNYFILSVFAALKTELNELDTCKCTRKVFPNIERCRELVSQLSRGLSRLSHGKAPLSDLTEDVVSELTLMEPGRDEYIRELLAQLITEMCKMKCISAYIITIDDSDTSSHQCFRVMEALRLYLNHPQIVVLMTGDKNMLLERIREHHFKEFDTNYHQYESQRKDIRMSAVVSHAGQYLLKLFPLYNQHELQNLLTLSRKSEPIILHVRYGSDHVTPLREIVTRAFSITISENITEIKAFVDQFFCLPLRAILQILKYWTDDGLWNILFSDEDPSTQHSSSEKYSDKQCVAYSVRMALKRVLQTELGSSRYNFESLLADDGRTFFSLMLHHCRDMDDLEHGFYLSGDMGSTKEDHYVTMLLAVTFGKIIKNLDGFISYLLYGPATVTLYAKAAEQYRHSSLAQNSNDINRLQNLFDNYLHVGSWQSATRWARHANMIWCYDENYEGIHSGILRLRHHKHIAQLKSCSESNLKNLSTIFHKYVTTALPSQKQVSDNLYEFFNNGNHPLPLQLEIKKLKDEFFKLMALSVSMSRSDERDNSYFISIYSFLAFVLKCLNTYKENYAYYATQNAADIDTRVHLALTKMISKTIPIKSCRSPEWLIEKQKGNIYNARHNDRIINLLLPKEKIDFYLFMSHALAYEICCWCKKSLTHEAVRDDLTPSKMGTMWSNLYYALKKCGHLINLEALKPVYETNSSNIALENYTGHISAFLKSIRFFIKFINLPTKDTLSTKYRHQIAEFPLTLHLQRAVDDFAKKLHEKSNQH